MDAGVSFPPPGPHQLFDLVGAGVPVRHTRTFAWVTVSAIWAVVLTTWLVGIRLSRVVDELRRVMVRTGSGVAVRRAADALSTVNRVSWVFVGLSAVALAIWSRCVAQNAARRGVVGVSVVAATFVWFVPLFGIRRGIQQLRRAVTAVDYSDHRLVRWLWTAYVNFFVSLFVFVATTARSAWAMDLSLRVDGLELRSRLLYVSAIWLAVSTEFATTAILHADRAVSTTR
jgi:hypothetical protein